MAQSSARNPAGREPQAHRFPATRWSLVADAIDGDSPGEAGDALEALCQCYWYPLYAFVRKWGRSPEDAEDLTQAFLAGLIHGNLLKGVGKEKGRLRTFLIVLLKRFLCDDHDRRKAIKRGGQHTFVSIDQAWAEGRFAPGEKEADSPEMMFDRQWALTVLDGVMADLREEYAASGKETLYEAIKGSLVQRTEQRPYGEVASNLGISENAVAIAVYRLRQRFRQRLHERILETVAAPEDVEEEIRYLCALFSQSGF